jgi:hypothetical protein
VELAVNRDDVVMQRPEDLQLLVPVFHTASACCGAATAYLLRRIAYRAGAYAPGIQEHIFHELNTSREGATIEKVQRWFSNRSSILMELGYRLQCRRAAIPTPAVLDWVRQGRGYRGAMLPTSFKRMHPRPTAAGRDVAEDSAFHAVGVSMEKLSATGDDELVMIDPWPGVDGDAPDRGKLSAALEAAHRDRNYHALVYYWVGWA